MKLAQYYHKDGNPRVALVEGQRLFPLTFDGDMLDYIVTRPRKPERGEALPLDEITFAPAVLRTPKIIALGLNYKDHAEESKGKPPENPLIFAKFPNSLAAHGADIRWDPKITAKVDYEAELAVIIGNTTRDCSPQTALNHVFGYTCANDVSARDLQFGDKQWVRGKSLDTFCPLGPWIVTPEEFGRPEGHGISCTLNGTLMQDSDTGNMVFPVAEVISFLSKHFTLYPGDVILTGTPAGVGAFRDPSVYLKDGDEVVIEIEGIGRLVNRCVAVPKA
ncbi:MAG: fumarylacetoacetate hydrolase family protein [Deltaproteobacteria bacterium]|mgnify:CR=1 FL=1|nr:fumarylacetoacetate hydrolase family protein [Deltaproteobacteria bacterium]MBW1924564.1 fumarylacetoacetate hydrolase family protein [Deltaproteobacteria bacterium]MBW1951157.1 fumarylacetoacetate hydrolase family protein [Deltaproteobacteria bacterium]MBW2009418.1 fumarylacetoacetate hydrolase family protein [Deltaproteobacteria bacterium]MBW2101930.1 fumarylacetoacetate hydrolase family protein [Deltaproteobacteria bacterium]